MFNKVEMMIDCFENIVDDIKEKTKMANSTYKKTRKGNYAFDENNCFLLKIIV